MNNLPPNSPMNPSIPLIGNQGSFLPPVLPQPHSGKMQPITPMQVQAGFKPSPMETLAIRVVLVAAAVFGALALLAVCAAMGPAGYAIAAVITGAAVTYMISKNVFGSRDFLVKVGNFAKSKFLAMKTAVQNRLNPPPAPPVAPIALQENAPVDVASKVQAEGATEHCKTRNIHSDELTRIYQAHLKGDLEKNNELVKQESSQNGVTRVRYIDPVTNVVKYEFNDFEPGFYNGPRRTHFEDRLTLIAETLEHNLPQFEGAAVRQKFEEHYKEQLEVVLGIDDRLITRDEAFTDENRKPLEEKFEAAKKVLQEAFEDASRVVAEHVKDASFVELEKQEVLRRGRPVIINTFQVPGDSQTYFSAQKPLLDETIPSSIRNQEGLCNAVMTFTGVVGGEDEGTLYVLHEASRHSSIPPIAIDDPVVRQQISAGNAMQELQQLVSQKVGDRIPVDNARDNPIELDWNNMILMTPKVVDNARNRSKGWMGTWKGEGETLMLKESIRALYYYSNRPVEVDVGGQKVWVKLNVSAMNLGCNTAALSHSTLGRIPNARTLNGLNAQGFMEFEIQTDHFIIDLLKGDPELSKLYNEYCQLKEHQHNIDFFAAKNQVNQALAPLQEELQNELAKDTPDKSRINDLNNQIHQHQKRLRKQSKAIYAKKIEAYKTRAQEIQEKKDAINALMQSKLDENSQLYSALLVLTNQAEFARSLKDGEHQSPDTIMRSQAIYIETMSLMNNWVSFFCKSGEDRTGAVDIETAARVISNYRGGEEKTAKITLFETSISRQVTRENSNSEGMQISPFLVPKEIRLKIWLQSKIAKLAKGVTKRDVGLLERVGNVFRGRQPKPWETGEKRKPDIEIGFGPVIPEDSYKEAFNDVIKELSVAVERTKSNKTYTRQYSFDDEYTDSELYYDDSDDEVDEPSFLHKPEGSSEHTQPLLLGAYSDDDDDLYL